MDVFAISSGHKPTRKKADTKGRPGGIADRLPRIFLDIIGGVLNDVLHRVFTVFRDPLCVHDRVFDGVFHSLLERRDIDQIRGSKMALQLNDYRLLGRSGLRVSPLSLGTMTFGAGPGRGSDDADAAKILTAIP